MDVDVDHAGSQQRMRTSSNRPDAREIAFAVPGATNLPDPNARHMHSLTLLSPDADHLTRKRTWREAGQSDSTEVFELARKK